MKREYDDEGLPLSKVPPVAEDVRRELAFHLEQRIAELVEKGMPPEEAIRQAREAFGDSTHVEAECRKIERRRRAALRRSDRLETLWQDVAVGFRVLRKNPGFTLTAVLTLALGTGAISAMFSIVNGVVLRPLPYPEPDRLVTVAERHVSSAGSIPWANFLDLEAGARSFDGMASYGSWSTTVVGTGRPVLVQAGAISRDFFKVFPVHLVLGRLPGAEEHRLGANPVAVVSHDFWRDVLGSPQSLENVRVKLGFDHQVVGVVEPNFDFPNRTQLWWPMELMEQSRSRTAHNWNVVARLRPGVTAADAERELNGILATLESIYQPDFDAKGSQVTGLHKAQTGPIERPLFLLLGASTLFLLAACSNLASALLARGTARLGELTVRSALGATRTRLVRQLLTESALLAVLGAMTGLAVAVGILQLMEPLTPDSLRMDRVEIDVRVALFTLGIALGTTLFFGFFPALRLSRTSAMTALRESGTRMQSAGRMRLWNVLVGAEVALAVALLSGSVLLIKSFGRIMETDLGFDPENTAAMAVELPSVTYPGNSSRVSAFHLQVLDGVAAVPGVIAAGFVNVPPLEGNGPIGSMRVEGKAPLPPLAATGTAIYRVVGGNYFQAMGMPLLLGRGFEPGDDAAAPKVLVVDEAFARLEWPGDDPLGKRVKPVGMDISDDEPWFTVIGVVPSVRSSSIIDDVRPTYYFDHRQRPPYRSSSVTYAVRTRMAPKTAFAQFRQVIRQVDPEVPTVLETMLELVAATVADKRFIMLVISTFGGLALLLAIVGIYGVISYGVAQRTREIGVRRALGATPGQVCTLVVRSMLGAVVPGLLIGGALTMANARTLGAFLYGVSPFDVATLVVAECAILFAAMVASIVPAGRAVRIDPLIAMRAE